MPLGISFFVVSILVYRLFDPFTLFFAVFFAQKCLSIEIILYLCNQVLADGRRRPKYNLIPECRVAVRFLLEINSISYLFRDS